MFAFLAFTKLKTIYNTDECFFVTFNVFVILVNKYVLSILDFTIPTVFQGWQTLVCVIILSSLIIKKKLSAGLQFLDRQTLTRLLFPLLCFTLANVAGSKSLAILPIPVFLAVTNLVPATIALIESNSPPLTLKVGGSACLWGSTIVLFVIEGGGSHLAAWCWMGVHVASCICQNLPILKLPLTHVNSVTIIYYRNFSSVVLLLPLSIYLEEAASALQYPHLWDGEFFIGCLLSGVLGTALQFLNATLEDRKEHSTCIGFSKIVASLFSYLFFTPVISTLGWCVIVFNLLLALFIFSLEENFDIAKTDEIV